jgi:hypothetical protein
MVKVLADKGYHYLFLFVRNAKHVDRPTIAQTLPAALEWMWKGHTIPWGRRPPQSGLPSASGGPAGLRLDL